MPGVLEVHTSPPQMHGYIDVRSRTLNFHRQRIHPSKSTNWGNMYIINLGWLLQFQMVDLLKGTELVYYIHLATYSQLQY